MSFVIIGLKCMFILLGTITVLIGKYLPKKYILSRTGKRKIYDNRNYVKGCRITLYSLGLYYIVMGIILLLISGWPMLSLFFSTFIPVLMTIFVSTYWRKHSGLTN